MTRVQVVVGAVMALIGLLFAGQGLNLVPGSFMTGDRTWFWVGLVLVVFGVVLVVAVLRRGPAARPLPPAGRRRGPSAPAASAGPVIARVALAAEVGGVVG